MTRKRTLWSRASAYHDAHQNDSPATAETYAFIAGYKAAMRDLRKILSTVNGDHPMPADESVTRAAQVQRIRIFAIAARTRRFLRPIR